MHACMCVCVHALMPAYLHACKCMCICAKQYVCVHVCAGLCARVGQCLHACMLMLVCVCSCVQSIDVQPYIRTLGCLSKHANACLRIRIQQVGVHACAL